MHLCEHGKSFSKEFFLKGFTRRPIPVSTPVKFSLSALYPGPLPYTRAVYGFLSKGGSILADSSSTKPRIKYTHKYVTEHVFSFETIALLAS